MLTALKKEHPSANYIVLVRSPSDVQALETIASSVVVGSFTEYDKVTSLVAEADIIINAADCDDVALADAIIAGLRRKKDKGHGVGTLIHTSGAAVFLDDVKDGTCPPDRKIANVCRNYMFLLIYRREMRHIGRKRGGDQVYQSREATRTC